MRSIYHHDAFWYDDPKVLVAQERLLEFAPSNKMNEDEKMNAVVRFSIYLAILLLVLGTNYRILFLPIIVAGGTALFKWRGERREPGEGGQAPDDAAPEDDTAGGGRESFSLNEDDPNRTRASKTWISKHPIGSNRVLPEVTDAATRDPHKCQPPSPNNPFMNILVPDYQLRPRRPPACTRKNDVNIKQSIERDFRTNLYQNLDDAWGRNNSQRQYFTMPSTTIPNDQRGFAEWLYKTPPILKEQGLVEHPKYALTESWNGDRGESCDK